MPARESGELDVEDVDAGRQLHEAHLPFLVGRLREHAADQRRRADADLRAGYRAALLVLDRTDERSGHTLRVSRAGQRHARSGHDR